MRLANRLAGTTSPYLLQHVRNPVDWYPWGEAAFARARRENRPVLLSIGYSTCHWCHVMAHECFEDDEVAALLNRDFVAIKVDREERPDIDQIYMDVCQRMTGQGGWPLTIFMTPEALPFYAATYLPKRGRQGRPGMMELLPLIAEEWCSAREQITAFGRQLINDLTGERLQPVAQLWSPAFFDRACRQLEESFDGQHGGFGAAPKFPRPHDLSFLLDRYQKTGRRQLLDMVEQTLQTMRCGGIYDQLGFGFHRYAVDAAWQVPHFEKMLYDQAGLLSVYAEAYQMTGQPLYARTAREIATYLKRDLRAPEGVFYSAEDADSEGVEGRYYVWEHQEIYDLLGDSAESFCATYAVHAAGNVHDEVTGERTGANVLRLAGPDALAQADRLAAARQHLLEARRKRARPHRDDKVVTAWNGMLLSALARAGRLLNDPSLWEDAELVARFFREQLGSNKDRLLRSSRHGSGTVPAFAEDYAYLACGFLDLYAVRFDPKDLLLAMRLATILADRFMDTDNGILYDTADDAEELVMRPRTGWDGAMPAAGSVALEVFARMALLTGEASWQGCAERLLASFNAMVKQHPVGYTRLLLAAARVQDPGPRVVVTGAPEAAETLAMLEAARHHLPRNGAVLFRPEPLPEPVGAALPGLMAFKCGGDKTRAFVCCAGICQSPCTDPELLGGILAADVD